MDRGRGLTGSYERGEGHSLAWKPRPPGADDLSYDGWLWDLDGTLIDVDWTYRRATFDRVGERLGREFSDEQVEILWYGLGGERNATLESWGLDTATFWAAFEAAEDGDRRAAATFRYDDAAVVGELDCPVGLVTHSRRDLVEPVLDRLDIRDWFDTIVCCNDALGWKPDPRPVELAWSRLGLDDRERGVLVGDGAGDVGAAHNAGLEAIHVERHDPAARGRCILAEYRIDSLAALDVR